MIKAKLVFAPSSFVMLMATLTKTSEMSVQSLWHPLKQHKHIQDNPPPVVVKGEGAILTDEHGNERHQSGPRCALAHVQCLCAKDGGA